MRFYQFKIRAFNRNQHMLMTDLVDLLVKDTSEKDAIEQCKKIIDRKYFEIINVTYLPA